MSNHELIRRLLDLSEMAVKQAIDTRFDDPEDYHISRELQELRPLVLQALAQPEPEGQTCPHIVSSDEGTSYCALAQQTHSKPTPNDRQIRSSAPADSLVERVSSAIDQSICPDQWLHVDAARAAIREAAKWLDTKGQHCCSLWLREESNR